MKKLIVFTLVFCVCAALLSGCAGTEENTDNGNYTYEMKIPYACDLSESDGADSVERDGDHQDSPYFSRLDFYNMESSDTLTILTHFKTQQQTSEWSCGVTSALMALNWFDRLGGALGGDFGRIPQQWSGAGGYQSAPARRDFQGRGRL